MNKFVELLYRIAFGLVPERTIRGSYRFLFLNNDFKQAIQIYKKTKARSKEQRNQKYYLSIVATIRNEDLYIQEWIEYYKIMGVDHFYIYDNESTDNLKENLQPYIDSGLVTYIYYPGEDVQTNIYNQAIEDYEKDSKWFAYLDIDEFVLPKTNQNLAEYLKTKEKYNQVTFQWILFGSSHHEKYQPGLVLENYTLREKGVNEVMKSIVQPQQTMFALVHKHSVLGKSLNAPYKEIQCNHYFCKSKEEYFAKKSNRGKNIKGNPPYTEEDFKYHDKNDIREEMSKDILEQIKQNLSKINKKKDI